MRIKRMTRSGLACTAAILSAGALLVSAAAAGATPAKDSFHGSIAQASGKLKGDHDEVTILLDAVPSAAAARRLTLTLESTCGPAEHCLRLLGVLSGTINARPQTIPDVGNRYEISASGRLGALGRVSATGVVTGVGFIRHGRETLTLRLRTAQGAVTAHAVSPTVPGFTSP